MLITAYSVALEGMPLEAILSTVSKLIKGTWSEPVKFVPWPPEFAWMVRKEDARIRELRTGRVNNTPLRNPPMVERMRSKMIGRKILATGVDFPTARNGNWPVGSVYVAVLETMFGPEEQGKQEKKLNAPYAEFKASIAKTRRIVAEAVEGEDIERIRKILALPVRPSASEEELQYAANIEKRIEGGAA